MKKLTYILIMALAAAGCSKDKSTPVDFTASKATVTAPEAVTFTNTSTVIGAVSWNFGDGYASTLENPTHIFKKAGSRKVVFAVASDNGIVGTMSKTITVKGITFSISNITGFDIGNVVAYYWDGSNIQDAITVGNVAFGVETDGYTSTHTVVNLGFEYLGTLYLVVPDFTITPDHHLTIELTPATQIYTGSRSLSRNFSTSKKIAIKNL